MILLLFWAVLSGAILAGLGFGRAPERIGAVIIAAAALGTVAVNQPDDLSARLSIAAINFILLTALTILAMRATRWWLLIAAGAQLAAVIVQLSVLLATSNIVVILSLAWGALEGRRARYARPENASPLLAGRRNQ